MTEPRRIDFSGREPVSHDADVFDRELEVGGARWALVEYAPGAGRAGWCDAPHTGFVRSGTLTYEFEDGRAPLVVRAGDGFVLPSAPRHRGRNQGAEPVRLFIVDALPAR